MVGWRWGRVSSVQIWKPVQSLETKMEEENQFLKLVLWSPLAHTHKNN